jgi:hypothetical protein
MPVIPCALVKVAWAHGKGHHWPGLILALQHSESNHRTQAVEPSRGAGHTGSAAHTAAKTVPHASHSDSGASLPAYRVACLCPVMPVPYVSWSQLSHQRCRGLPQPVDLCTHTMHCTCPGTLLHNKHITSQQQQQQLHAKHRGALTARPRGACVNACLHHTS